MSGWEFVSLATKFDELLLKREPAEVNTGPMSVKTKPLADPFSACDSSVNVGIPTKPLAPNSRDHV